MDPLSISASVAGLLTLAGTVIGNGTTYVRSVLDHPKALDNLLNETKRLDAILRQIRDLAQGTSAHTPTSPTTTSNKLSEVITPEVIQQADTLLKSVRLKLEECQRIHGKKGKGSAKAIIWPFQERAVNSTLDEFRRLTTTLDQALNVDSSRTLHDIHRRGNEFYDTALSTLTELHKETSEVHKRTKEITDQQESAKRQKLDTDESVRKHQEALEVHCESVRKHNEDISTHINREQREKILKWIDPASVDPETNHRAARKLSQPGTGQWFIESDEYGKWSRTDSSLLWLFAIPGAGKTILMSTILEHLRTNLAAGTGLAYFYCDYKDTVKQTLQGFLSSILVQLCNQNSSVFTGVKATYDSQKDCHRALRPDELVEILKMSLQAFKTTLILVDALDECTEVEAFVETILEIKGSLCSNVKLIVSSRREACIADLLGKTQLQVELKHQYVTEDIDTYITSQLQSILESGKLKLRNPALGSEIKEALISGSQGMFQWVKCQLDHLCTLKNDKAIRNALHNLPNGIDETYVRILERIKRDNPEQMTEILNLLQWVVASKRPLTVEELAQAITIEPGDRCLDFDAVATNPEDILRPCATLLTVTRIPRSRRLYPHILHNALGPGDTALQVGFGHFSIKEFLVSLRIKDTAASEFFMGDSEKLEAKLFEACITYLSFDDFVDPDLLNMTQEGNYHLLSYAANFWPAKLSIAQQGMLRANLFRQDDERANFVHWLALLLDGGFPLLEGAFINVLGEDGEKEQRFKCLKYQLAHTLTPLMMSAHRGYDRLVQLLLRSPREIGQPRAVLSETMSIFGTDSHWLEKKLALPSMGAEHWICALGMAVKANQVKVVKILLAHGKQVDTAGHRYSWLLQTNTHKNVEEPKGRVEIVNLLLGHEVDVNAQGGPYGNALQAAALIGSLDIVTLLIQHGADVNAQEGEYGNALQAAAWSGSLDIVTLLIQHGADVNAQGGNFGNALQAASLSGPLDIVTLLIQNGADVNAQEGEYGNALQAASLSGSLDIVTLLIQHGADVNTQGGRFGNALQAAAWSRSLDIVTLLIQHGADGVDASYKWGYETAIQAARIKWKSSIARMLF